MLYRYKYTYIYTSVLLTLLGKKENAVIIHSAMETWKYAIIRNFIISSLYPFSKISHPLDSEPATPLHSILNCTMLYYYVILNYTIRHYTILYYTIIKIKGHVMLVGSQCCNLITTQGLKTLCHHFL